MLFVRVLLCTVVFTIVAWRFVVVVAVVCYTRVDADRFLQSKAGFQPTQRMQGEERNEMTSLLDRPITAASDDGVCRWHAVADTREIIEIKFDLHHKLHN